MVARIAALCCAVFFAGQSCATESFISEEHGKPGDRVYTAYTTIVPAAKAGTILYEVCNRGEQDLIFLWVEPFFGVGGSNPLKAGECPQFEVSGTEASDPTDSSIKYAHNDLRSARTFLPKPAANGGGLLKTISTFFKSKVGGGRQKTPNTVGKDAQVLVRVSVENKGGEANFIVEWKERIGPLALKYIATDEGVRQGLGRSIAFKSLEGSAFVSTAPASKVVSGAEAETLPPVVKEGDYIYITPKSDSGIVTYQLPTSQGSASAYQPILLRGPDGKLNWIFSYKTPSIGK